MYMIAYGSNAVASSRTRNAMVLPYRGIEPIKIESKMSGMDTGRIRWSVPNGNGSKMLADPFSASGHAGALLLANVVRPTHRTMRPGCSSLSGSIHTAPNGRRRPEASLSRRSATSATVTP